MAKRNLKKHQEKLPEQPVTGTTLEEHRRDILARARKFIRPVGVSRRKFLLMSAAILTLAVVVLLGVFGLLIYRYQSESNLIYRASQILPYPAAKLDDRLVYYGDYLFELRPLKHYVQNVANQNAQGEQQPVDFNTEEGQKRLDELRRLAMESAKRKAMVKILAEQNNVSVSRQQLDEAVEADISNQGGEKKFQEAIQFYYGWSVGDYRRVKEQQLLEKNLQPVFSQSERLEAEAVLQKIKNGGKFAVLAKKYSEDPGSKDDSGDLGLSSRGAYVAEFEAAAYELQPGEVSEIVQTEHGFHIIKMTDRKEDQIQVSHILIQYADLGKLIKEKLSQASYYEYVDIPAAEGSQE